MIDHGNKFGIVNGTEDLHQYSQLGCIKNLHFLLLRILHNYGSLTVLINTPWSKMHDRVLRFPLRLSPATTATPPPPPPSPSWSSSTVAWRFFILPLLLPPPRLAIASEVKMEMRRRMLQSRDGAISVTSPHLSAARQNLKRRKEGTP